jgi:hypothetical protein
VDEEQISHDQLFKELLRTFFREFMELFFPAVAARLDFSRVTFLDKEVFTDVPEGELRVPDVVAQVYTLDGVPEMVLMHVEVEARHRRSFGERMHEYYMLLRLRFRLPVFPVVIYLSRGAGGIGRERYAETIFDQPVLWFWYHRVAVRDLPAEPYLEGTNPLGYGLAALMRSSVLGPVELKVECLLRIARALIDEARKVLLSNYVETYLRLDEEQQGRFEQLIRQPAYQEVEMVRSVYEIEGERRGKQEAALLLLREKFGELPEHTEARVRSLQPEAELEALLRAILHAHSLAELGLDNPSSS